MPNKVSIGQACSNALAQWLKQHITPDVTVYDRWPEQDVNLFTPPAINPGGPNQRGSITIVRIGARTRGDVWGVWQGNPALLTADGINYIYTFQIGNAQQPMQIDVWAGTDDDRDDIVAQLDTWLYAGIAQTLNIPGEIVRDGLLLQLQDGQPAGTFSDYWFDDVEISDTPEAIQQSEYRATYFGQARTGWTEVQTVPGIQQATVKLQDSLNSPPPPGTLYQTATVQQNPSPPPIFKVTFGTSS